jgi:hypothetical protein
VWVCVGEHLPVKPRYASGSYLRRPVLDVRIACRGSKDTTCGAVVVLGAVVACAPAVQ